MTTVICANPACQRPFAARRNHGKLARFCSPGCYQAARDTRHPAVCANPACQRPFTARPVKGGFTRFCCQACWLAVCPHPRSADHPSYRAEPGYWTKHSRVRHARGPAKVHPCADCGAPARDWSLIHGRDGRDPADYEPRCRRCHITYDKSKAVQGQRADARASRYKGVSRIRKGQRRRWFATIGVKGQPRRVIGYYDDEESAARAYDAAAREAWGESAWLNFPAGLAAGPLVLNQEAEPVAGRRIPVAAGRVI